MMVLFLVLVAIISSYWYLTDSSRVREMAQSYLSDLLGGTVEVGGANLSIFEGLRLDDVRVLVDDANSADSVLFSAQTFVIRYDLRAMLHGRLEATQIIATDPHVRMTENIDLGKWNYQRMQGPSTPTSQPSGAPGGMKFPEILLRNAQIDYSEIRDGRYRSLGSLAIEAQLTPLDDSSGYRFDLQSRGASDRVGPVVSGSLDLSSGQFTARLKNFEFGRDIRSMLPAEVRQWWEQHELAGRVDIPELTYTPSKNGSRSKFKVETDLNGVTLVVKPHELMSREEADRRLMLMELLRVARSCGAGGPVRKLIGLVEPTPIRLEKVAGTFVFTESGIDIQDVSGRVETNGLRIGGHIGGYTPDAPFDIRISSLATENLYIPAAPRYVNSLPPQVREVYDRLRPQGTCSIVVLLNRDKPGARPEVSGEVNVIDGQFVFDRFPYPLRHASGKIVFGRKSDTRMEFLEIQGLSGRGVEGGPNQDRTITVTGLIGPFGPTSAVNIRVEGKDITCEPALRAAFPTDVQRSLRSIFTRTTAATEVVAGTIPELPEDPDYPQFTGDFTCDVIRPLGLKQRWRIDIDLDIKNANGALTVFPYPLRDVTCKLKIRGNYIEIIDATTRQGDASLVIGGRVDFGQDKPIRPNLKIVARNVPIDDDLLNALSPQQRQWMQKVGVGGTFDLDGGVFPRDPAEVQPGQSSTQYAFDINLRDGTMWPTEGTFALSGLNGNMKLAPQRLMLTGLKAKRGRGEITLRGSVAWPNDQPQIALNASATNLDLDASLYAMLPPAAKRGWDEVQPNGTVDAELSYSGGVNTSPNETSAFEVVIKPKKLSATVQSVPYRLDELDGVVSIFPDRVILKDVTGVHGKGRVSLSGTGTLGTDSTWDLILAARDLAVDADLKKALPESLQTVIKGLELKGAISFDFTKLHVHPNDAAASAVASLQNVSVTTRPASQADIDFATTIWLGGASMDVGVPLKDVVAEIKLVGAARKGKLSEMTGSIAGESFTLAQRTVNGLQAELIKPPGQDALRIANMRASLAGGEMAGQVDLAYPDVGPSRYAMNLVIRDADVSQLAPQDEQDISGRLSASLSLEGDWSDLTSRRGRGDVLVSGDEMYKIPLVLGLLQITNLALPITTPFSEATATYSMEGSRVTFEGIELKSSTMMMQGDGYLDFDTRKVSLSFVTDNPNWPPIPIVGDLFRSAKNELLRIQIRGSIQEPKVSAASMNTFTTTVDEVFKQ
jgi:hypothetical protein